MTGGAPPDRHLITIEPVSLGERSYRYGVTYDGRVLIESSRVPALDTCRVLLASPASWKSGGRARHGPICNSKSRREPSSL